MSDNFQVNKQFAKFKGKDVLIGLKNWEEVEGKIIGALGVSGGTAEQDTMLAAYGKEILKEEDHGFWQ